MKTTYTKLLVLCSSIATCLILLHCSKNLSASNRADRADTLKVQNNNASKDIVTINGITLNFDEIPFNGSGNIYQLPVAKSLKSANLENGSRLLARSFNKQYIAFSRTTYTDSVNTTLTVYSKSGALLWEVKSPLRIDNFRVSEDGNYTYAVWHDYTDTLDTYYLTSYGKKGNVIDNIKGVEKFYTGKYADKVLYQRKDINGNSLIGFLDYSGNQKWEKNYFPDAQIASVSINAKNIIVRSLSQKTFCSINSKGEILWRKNEKGSGHITISSNNKYLAWLPNPGRVKIINNENGDVLYEIKKLNIDKEIINFDYALFVENANKLALTSYTKEHNTKIIFIKLNGEYIDQTTINGLYTSVPFITISDDKQVDIYFDGIKVQTFLLKTTN